MTAAKAVPKMAARAAGTDAAPASPAEFVRLLERAFEREGAQAAAACFERYGSAMAPLLVGRQRTRVEEIMHVVDTAIGWKPPMGARAVVVVPEEHGG